MKCRHALALAFAVHVWLWAGATFFLMGWSCWLVDDRVADAFAALFFLGGGMVVAVTARLAWDMARWLDRDDEDAG